MILSELLQKTTEYDKTFNKELYKLMEQFAKNPSNANRYFTAVQALVEEKYLKHVKEAYREGAIACKEAMIATVETDFILKPSKEE